MINLRATTRHKLDDLDLQAAAERAAAAVSAGLPVATSALGHPFVRRRAVRMAPLMLVRTHPVLLGSAIVLAVAGGIAFGIAVRRRSVNGQLLAPEQPEGAEETPERSEAIDRLENEGGRLEPGEHRFVRLADPYVDAAATNEA